MTEDVFSDTHIAATLSAEQLEAKMRELDFGSDYDKHISKGSKSGLWDFITGRRPLWLSNAHAFGFVAEATANSTELPICEVGQISPRKDLANRRLNITLNYLRVAEYPGSGTHRILFDFYTRNQMATTSEEVHFNTTYRVLEGERAGIKGFPIFVGLGVGTEGLAFRCFTVNVKNDDDEKFLSALDSDVFKAGLRLASTAQPAIAPLSSMAVAFTKAIAGRHRNIAVQDFYLGLDFTKIPGGGRLSTGSYIVVQIPESDALVWNWDDWVFSLHSGQVVSRANPNMLIPFNYIVFGISEYSGV
jgi:hypothetical protein